MEKSWKMGEKNSHGNSKRSWNFSTAYRRSCMRNSDNSISTDLLQCFVYGRLSVYVQNRIVRQEKTKTFLTPYFQFG